MINWHLFPATLVRRYKRFLADVIVEPSTEAMTIYCPNTGAMTGCGEAGNRIFYSVSDSKTRKYKQTWEVTELSSGAMICVNPQMANEVVMDALDRDLIPELAGYTAIDRERRYGKENSRIDFLLSGAQDGRDCYVEVKSCTLQLDGTEGAFPDAVSKRALKHLRELKELVSSGHRAVLMFAVLHTGIDSVRAAWEVDPAYAKALDEAVAAGVEVLAYGAAINLQGAELNRKLPFISYRQAVGK